MKHRFLLAVLPLLSASLFACGEESKEYIGIISAMDNEIAILLEEAKIEKTETYGGSPYYVGTLRNKNVVITRSGIGKIRCASGAAAMLNRFNVSKMIFTGIAGAVAEEAKVLDEVIATEIVEHDYGIIANDGFHWRGGDPGYGDQEGIVYHCDQAMVDLAYQTAVELMGESHVHKGLIASGDQFIASESYVEKLREDFNAFACEMEGASVAAVCENYNKPYVVLRALSDKADGEAHESYEGFGDLAAAHSSGIVLEMMESL